MMSHAALSPSPAGGLQSSSRPPVDYNQTAVDVTVAWASADEQSRGQDRESRDNMKNSGLQEANTSDSQGAKTQSADKSKTKGGENPDEDNAKDENVQQAVFVDPNERSDNVGESSVYGQAKDTNNASEAGRETNEEEEEDDEQISRRIFLGAQKLIDPADWLKLRGQRSKLFGASHSNVKKNPKRKRRKNLNKSRQPNGKSQTRRGLGAVAHEGFAGLADHNSTSSVVSNLNPISSSLRQHFPSLSGSIPQAVQRLLQTKLSASSMVAVPARQPSQPAMSAQQYFNHVNRFMDHQHQSDHVNQWSSSDELPTYTPSEPLRLPMNSASQPGQPMNSGQMIPIKIIGLDPTVAESILNAPNEAHTSSLRPVNYPVSAATTAGIDADGGSRDPRLSLSDRQRASSIVHIHHFHHTQAKSANQQQQQQQQPPQHLHRQQRLPPTSNSPSGPNDQRDETNHSVDSQSSAVQQPDKVYVNEKGELVQLLASGEVSPASVEPTEMNSSNGSSGSSREQQQLSHETTEQPAGGPAGRPGGDLKNVDQPEAQPEHSSQIDANETQEQANRQQQQQQQQLHTDPNGQDIQTMEGSGETGDSSRGPSTVANRPIAISVGARQRLQLIPNSGSGNADQLISVIGGSPEAVEGHPNSRGQFLMVAYKPQHLMNMTGETEESSEVNMLDSRMPYNEESASSVIAAKDLLRQPVRAAQMLLRPISVAQVNSELPIVRLQPQLNMTDIRNLLTRYRPSETTDLGLPPKLLHLPTQVGNQVPSASSLHLASLDGHSSNYQRLAQPSWPSSLGQTDQSFNETSAHPYPPDALPTSGGAEAGAPDVYGHRLLGALVKNNGSLSLHQRQNLMENLALLRHLHQQVESKQRAQTRQLHQQLSHLPTPIGGHPLANGSDSSKLTNQHLLSLMSELKLTNGSAMSAGTNSGSSGSGDHSISGNGFTDLNAAGLSSAPALGAKQTARFELTHAGDQQAGAKHLSSHPTVRTPSVSNTNGLTDHFHPSASTKGSGLVRDPSDRLASKAATAPDGQDFHSYIRPMQALPEPPATSDFADFRDSNGLSNIALAFILVVSFITLTIIAASMIYRRRRLTVSRSADLQSKTRLDPLRRTRQFMRANFVTSNDATSAKTINMDNSSLPLVKNRLFGRNNQTIGDKSSMLRSSGRKMTQASREASSEDTSVSTFTGQTLNGDKRQCGPDTSRADIRTLDTRIQRPSHLKSLISSPECLLGHTKTKQLTSNRSANQAPETMGSSSSSSGYLNTNNRVSDSCVKQTLARTSSPAIDPGCSGRNYSLEKVLCDPRHHPNYSSSTKRSIAAEKRSVVVEQKANYSNRMSTIRSVDESSADRNSNLTKRFPDDTNRVSFRTGLKDHHWPSTE